jgi:ABC-2 type transport system ATP-binding protein
LILDEPTDGLDPVGRSEVRRLLLELKGRGKTIFLNSHILQEVELVCDRVAIMASGQIRGVGTIDDLTEQLGNRTVRLELAATWSDDQVRHVLSEAIGVSDPSAADTQSPAPLQMVRIGNHTWRVNIPWRDQASIDRLVDRLRQADISILSLTTPKRTLEDVFLSLVGSVPIDQELGAPLLDAGSLDARLDLDRNTAEGVPDRTAAAMLSSTDNDPQQRDRQQRSPVGQVSPVRGGTS